MIDRLFALTRHKNPSIQLRAIEQVLDRKMGRPKEAMEINEDRITITTKYVSADGKLLKENESTCQKWPGDTPQGKGPINLNLSVEETKDVAHSHQNR